MESKLLIILLVLAIILCMKTEDYEVKKVQITKKDEEVKPECNGFFSFFKKTCRFPPPAEGNISTSDLSLEDGMTVYCHSKDGGIIKLTGVRNDDDMKEHCKIKECPECAECPECPECRQCETYLEEDDELL